MAFTMHSHSGQFCPGHAVDSLESVIQHAISRGYTTMGLTEHMPRTAPADLYPEELDDPGASLAVMPPRHEAYLLEAQRMRDKYAGQIHILVGFEGEWLRDEYAGLVLALARHEAVDYFIGSLHHVNGIPIDYDKALYQKALESVTANPLSPSSSSDQKPTEEQMYARYYDEHLEMLQAQKPRVVGHFDLIRLLSSQPDRRMFDHETRTPLWPSVWSRILRNLEYVRSYGGWLEVNSAALRKGLAEPYPARDIAEEWIGMGGRFTLSDDSHGIAQVGTNYARTIAYLEMLGVRSVWTLERVGEPAKPDGSGRKAELRDKEVGLDVIKAVVAEWDS